MSEASNNISKLHKYYPATISSIWSKVKGTQWWGLFIFYISYGICNDNMFFPQVGVCSGAEEYPCEGRKRASPKHHFIL